MLTLNVMDERVQTYSLCTIRYKGRIHMFVVALMVMVFVRKDLLMVTYYTTLIWKGNWISARKSKLNRSRNRCFKITQKRNGVILLISTCTLGNSNDNLYAQNALILIINSSFFTVFWGLLTR